jgi:hypothetical protein
MRIVLSSDSLTPHLGSTSSPSGAWELGEAMGLRSTRLFAVTSTSMEEESGYVLYFALTVLTVWEEGFLLLLAVVGCT